MREYSTDEITVFWDAPKCIHAGECVKGLPQVFDRSKKPWINVRGASAREIMEVIDRCPSGALSYRRALPHSAEAHSSGEISAQGIDASKADPGPGHVTRIKVLDKGPLLVEGGCVLVSKAGGEEFKSGPFSLCRCGRSKNKPYCDGSHRDAEFDS